MSSVRRPLVLLAQIAIAVLGLLTPGLVGSSGALWWQLAPWALLALFWAAVAIRQLHARRRAPADDSGRDQGGVPADVTLHRTGPHASLLPPEGARPAERSPTRPLARVFAGEPRR